MDSVEVSLGSTWSNARWDVTLTRHFDVHLQVLLPVEPGGGPCIGTVELTEGRSAAEKQVNRDIQAAVRSEYELMCNLGEETSAMQDGSPWLAGCFRGHVYSRDLWWSVPKYSTGTVQGQSESAIFGWAVAHLEKQGCGYAAVAYLHEYVLDHYSEEEKKIAKGKNSARKFSARKWIESSQLIGDESDGGESIQQAADSDSFTQQFRHDVNSLRLSRCRNCLGLEPKWPTVVAQGSGRQPSTQSICSRCKADKITFHPSNSLHPVMPPPELACLNDTENLLVCRIHTVVHVVKWKGTGQRVLSGNVTHVPINNVTIFDTLPCVPEDLPMLLIREHGQEVSGGWIDIKRVKKALVWLKKNNPAYADVKISAANMSRYASEANYARYIRSKETPARSHVQHFDTLDSESEESYSDVESDDDRPEGVAVPNIVVGEDLSRQSAWYQAGKSAARHDGNAMPEQFRAGPYVGPEYSQPISDVALESTPGFLSMAFPTLFSTGRGDFTLQFHTKKPKDLRSLVNFLLWWSPEAVALPSTWPFQANRTFPLWAFDVIRRQKLIKASSWVASQALSSLPVECPVDEAAAELQAPLKSSVSQLLHSVPGSASYMQRQRKNLEALIEAKGAPTIFFTLSAADLRWPETLALANGGLEPQVADRQRVINSAPATVDALFRLRVEAFVHRWLHGELDAEYFWFRVEWQSRGAPHVHGIAKLKSDPGVIKLGRKVLVGTIAAHALGQEQAATATRKAALQKLVADGEAAGDCIREYGDSLISCCTQGAPPCSQHPAETEPGADVSEDVAKCVAVFQRHTRHSATCLRKDGDGNTVCRFGYPQPLREVSKLVLSRQPGLSPEELPDAVRDSMDYDLEQLPSFHVSFMPKRNDALVNPYNSSMIAGWRANVDIKLITDLFFVIAYVSKYATKAECASQAFGDLFRTISMRKEAALQSSGAVKRYAQSMAASLLIQMSSPRDVSIQEAVRHISGIPIVQSSFSMQDHSISQEVWRKHHKNAIEYDDAGNAVLPLSVIHAYEQRTQAVPTGRQAADTPSGTDASLTELSCFEFYQTYAVRDAKQSLLRLLLTEPYSHSRDSQRFDDHVSLTPISAVSRKPRAPIPVFLPGIIADCGSTRYGNYCKQQLLKHTTWLGDTFALAALERAGAVLEDEALACAWNTLLLHTQELVCLSRSDNLLQIVGVLLEHDLLRYANEDVTGLEEYVAPPDYEQYGQLVASSSFIAALRSNGMEHVDDVLDRELDNTINLAEAKAIAQSVQEGINDPASSDKWLSRMKDTSEYHLEVPVVSKEDLNPQQKHIFEYLERQVRSSSQALLLVHGTAGTGKSFLVNAISTKFGARVLRLAPTGVAAANIVGETIHGALHIKPLQRFSEDIAMAADKCADIRAKLAGESGIVPDIIIVDEISMVHARTFSQFEARCQQVLTMDETQKQLPFGGNHVILLGDFGQLPPVKGNSLIAPLAVDSAAHDIAVARQNHAHALFRDKFVKIELAQIMRQGDPSQQKWRKALLNIRAYDLDAEDIQLLQSAFATSTVAKKKLLATSVHLFCRNVNVDLHSFNIWRQYSHRLMLGAHHAAGGAHAATAKPQDAGRLMNPLLLAIDMPVSISWNLWVNAGIANGTRGIFKGLALKQTAGDTGYVPISQVVGAYVQLEETYMGPSISSLIPRLICVPTKTASYTLQVGSKRVKCLRKQLPLLPDVARTVHKAQGLTLPRAHVEVDCTRRAHGLAFVSLSRTPKLEDMYLSSFDLSQFTKASAGGVWPPRLRSFLQSLKESSALFFSTDNAE